MKVVQGILEASKSRIHRSHLIHADNGDTKPLCGMMRVVLSSPSFKWMPLEGEPTCEVCIRRLKKLNLGV